MQLAEASTQTAAQLRATVGTQRGGQGIDMAMQRGLPLVEYSDAQMQTSNEVESQTDAISTRDTNQQTNPFDGVGSEALQELERRRQIERDSEYRERSMLIGKIARNLGQSSAELGAIPFIDSAAAAASSCNRRSRSPPGPKQAGPATTAITDDFYPTVTDDPPPRVWHKPPTDPKSTARPKSKGKKDSSSSSRKK